MIEEVSFPEGEVNESVCESVVADGSIPLILARPK